MRQQLRSVCRIHGFKCLFGVVRHDSDLEQAKQNGRVAKQKGSNRDRKVNNAPSYSEYYLVALADALMQSYQYVVRDDLRSVVSSVEDRV